MSGLAIFVSSRASRAFVSCACARLCATVRDWDPAPLWESLYVLFIIYRVISNDATSGAQSRTVALVAQRRVRDLRD